MLPRPATDHSATVLARADWQRLQRNHQERAKALTSAHLERRARAQKHPIWDFLFTYYSHTPAQLARWYPGVGVVLRDAGEFSAVRYYAVAADGSAALNLAEYWERRGATVRYIANLLRQTLERKPQFGCFGLHEWAMVYHLSPEQLRHRGLRLRLGHAATDEVVDAHRIGCSHFDAYRFFTPDAAPLNIIRPTRETQPDFEQSACLHAGMDIYKWATKLAPLLPGELVLDAFELARDIRLVDMQASPYDVTDYGYQAIPIETAAGKAQYTQLQRGFADRGNRLRERVLDSIRVAGEELGEAI